MVCEVKFGAKILPVYAAITRSDLSATILLKLIDSYLIAFKFAQ